MFVSEEAALLTSDLLTQPLEVLEHLHAVVINASVVCDIPGAPFASSGCKLLALCHRDLSSLYDASSGGLLAIPGCLQQIAQEQW